MSDNIFDETAADGASGNSNNPLGLRKRLILGIAAVVLILALGVASPLLLNMTGPQPDEQTNQAGENTALSLSIEAPVSHYTPLLSSTPGLPLRAICPLADQIQFSTDAGSLLLWAAPDYEVRQAGQSFVGVSGDTVYLTPDTGRDTAIGTHTVTVSAIKDGREAGRAVIVIGYMDGYYTIQNLSVSLNE